MKILFTAFKGVYNTSFLLVDQTAANYILLTNSFQGLEKDISFVGGDYSIVYMFGVDKELIDKVRIEKCAKYNAETVCTDFDIYYLETMLRSVGVSYSISDKPTRYLCNAAYYHMLKKNSNTVFIHIPSLKGMSVELMNKLIKIFNDICSNENCKSSNSYAKTAKISFLLLDCKSRGCAFVPNEVRDEVQKPSAACGGYSEAQAVKNKEYCGGSGKTTMFLTVASGLSFRQI